MADDERPGLARRPAVLTALAAVLVFAALAAVLVPWSWVPGGQLTPVKPGQLFTAKEIERAAAYSDRARLVGLSSYAVSLVVALGLGLTALGGRLVRWLPLTRRWWVAVPVGTAALLAIGRLVTLPFAIAARAERVEYGLTNQGLGGWAVDYVKGFGVGWVGWTLLLLAVVGLARRSPRWWFAWAGAAAALLVGVGSYLYPVLVEPVFNRFEPMPAGALRDSVFRLAEREGVPVDEVLVADASRRTTTVNAYVSGLGGTRRVVVYDNLLTELTPDEARRVIAHELGHAKNHDVALGTLLGSAGSVLAITLLALLLDSRRLRRLTGISGPGDPAAVAVVLALAAAGMFLVSPVQNSISRAIEARADRVSIEATGRDRVFVRMQHKLAVSSLSDPDPPALTQFWFGTHPTAVQRAGLPASLLRAAGQ